MTLPVLGHRIILRPESRLRKVSAASVVNEIMSEVPVPVPASQQEEAEDVFA
jgi:MoxR-like ATPase